MKGRVTIFRLVKEKKNVFLYSLLLFVIFSCTYLVISLFLQINANEVKRAEVVKNEERLVEVESHVLSNKINSLISDILYISDSFNGHNSDSDSLKELKEEWISFANRKMIYDQIRFIQSNGDEKIRINYYSDGSKAVDEANLQNKKDRYYFTDTISLKQNQIYISKLDLNIENGKIEQPIKPMIRLSTPVYDSQGKLLGVVVLNYYAKYLLNDFENIASTGIGDMFLLDSNGYWIINDSDKTKEWSFMYEEKKTVSFKNQYPDVWDRINKNENGSIKTQNGYFVYTNIIPITGESNNSLVVPVESIILGEGNWLAVSYLSNNNKYSEVLFSSIPQTILYTIKEQLMTFVVIFLISLMAAILIMLNKVAKDRIKYFSEYDAMTGVYNRRVGYELLEKSYGEITNNKGRISVCFVDINGLKEVNDNLGHEAGDELILSVVNGIKKCIRQTDYIIRFGGDEFLIVFLNVNEEQAEAVWGTINDEYKKINENEQRKYIVSASHGIAELKFDSNEYIDSIINAADEKMYNEKRVIKSSLDVIKKS